MNRCTCSLPGPEDPCGHSDTSEGCPVHDPSLVDADDLARAVGALLEDYAASALADQLGVDEDDAPMLAFGEDGVRLYADAGLLTRDAGVVVRLENGAEFQLTVVRSR